MTLTESNVISEVKGNNETTYNYCNEFCRKLVDGLKEEIVFLKAIICDLQKDKVMLQKDKTYLISLISHQNEMQEEIAKEFDRILLHKTDTLEGIYKLLENKNKEVKRR